MFGSVGTTWSTGRHATRFSNLYHKATAFTWIFVCIVTQWRMGLVRVKQRGNEQMLQWKKMTCGNRHNKTFKNLFRRTGMSQEKVISKGSLLPYRAKDCRLGPQTRSHGCQRAARNVLRTWGIGTFLSHGKTDPPEVRLGAPPNSCSSVGQSCSLRVFTSIPWEQFLQVFWLYILSKCALSSSCCFWNLPLFWMIIFHKILPTSEILQYCHGN